MSVFQAIYDFITVDIYNVITDSVAYIILKLTVWRMEFEIAFIKFSWDVASQIISDLQITQKINQHINLLPADVVAKLHFFNVTTGINLMLNAYVTRYVMGFIR